MKINNYIFLFLAPLLFSFQSFEDVFQMEYAKVNELAKMGDTAVLPLNPELVILKYSYSNSTKIAGKIKGYTSAFIHLERHEESGWTGYLMIRDKNLFYKVSTEKEMVIFTKVGQEDIFQE